MEPEQLVLNGVLVTPPDQGSDTVNAMIWGKSGCGKSTLVATFPGPILFIMLDPNGHRSLTGAPNVLVMNLSDKGPLLIPDLKKENPLGIEEFIEKNGIKTVVIDSVSVLSDLALEHGIKHGGYGPSIKLEDPGFKGWGHRSSVVLSVVKQFIKSCMRKGAHCVLVAHEDKPTTDDKGNVLFISIMLGGSTPEKTGLRLDEIWHVTDTGTERRILVRPARGRTPMKSRMFDAEKSPEFVWKFDAKTWTGMRVDDWITKWKEGKFKKMELPR